jgi:hypothetical protein
MFSQCTKQSKYLGSQEAILLLDEGCREVAVPVIHAYCQVSS